MVAGLTAQTSLQAATGELASVHAPHLERERDRAPVRRSRQRGSRGSTSPTPLISRVHNNMAVAPRRANCCTGRAWPACATTESRPEHTSPHEVGAMAFPLVHARFLYFSAPANTPWV
jgi:hypothetical protein